MGKKHRGKSTANKTNKKQGAGLAEKTEQILLTMPRIIATQISKDLVGLKQQESKLKTDLQKAEAQKKKLTLSLGLLKKQNTAAAKKQSKMLQQKRQKLSQWVTMLARSLEMLVKQAAALSQKKAKYNALQAQLMLFQKEWAKKSSQKAAKPKKAKIKAKSEKAAGKSTMKKSEARGSSHYPYESQVVEIMELPAESEVELHQAASEKMS